MKSISMRALALILTLCMIMSFMIPAVWAEESGVLTYKFCKGENESNISSSDKNNYFFAGATEETENYSKLLYMSNRTISYNVNGAAFTMKFKTEDGTQRSWFAILISDVEAKTYDMTFQLATDPSNGKATVYVLTEADFSDAIASVEEELSTNANANLTLEQNNGIFNALEPIGKGEISCLKMKSDMVLGRVTFPEVGNYVLLFECLEDPNPAPADTSGLCRTSLQWLTMTPIVASVTSNSETTYYTNADAVVNAIKTASSGTTIQLLDNMETAAEITLQNGVTMDLNGKTLTAKAVTVDPGGKLVYNSGVLNAELHEITQEDRDAADAVQAKISAIGEVTLESEAAINEAYAAYAALSEDQKELVDIAPLNAALQALVQIKADLVVIEDVQEGINAISEVTLESEASINALAAAYMALTGAQKKLVDTTKLVEAQKKLAELKNPGVVVPDDSGLLVESECVVMDAIQSVEMRYMATAVVNGHDYMYMLFNGQTLMVYDLDTGELVDKESNCFATSSGLYVDPDGIVWVGGSKRMLYKYNPYTMVSEVIPYPADEVDTLFPVNETFASQGITGDGNGNLYYGTYNRTYVGKFDTKTYTWSRLSEELNTSETLAPDGLRSGFGGVLYHDGYVYMTVDGDANGDRVQTHVLIKFDLATNEIVDHIDLSALLGSANWLEHLALVDNVILGSTYKALSGTVAIDISGEKMKLIEIEGLPHSFSGAVSAERNGKVYMMGAEGEGLLEYDIATRSVKATGIAVGTGTGNNAGTLRCTAGTYGWVTIDHPDLPGESLVTFINDTQNNALNLVFYNPTTGKTVVMEDYTDGQGSGNTLRALALSEDKTQIYIGAYEDNQLGIYDVEAGEMAELFATASDQIEGLIWYDGYLYSGNYSTCSILQIDLENQKVKNLGSLSGTPFYQQRIHANTTGEGKVFFATAGGKNTYGGMLYWYDVEKNLVYLAAGPNPEDVYYFNGSDFKGQWYKALNGEPISLDFNGDGSVSKEDGVTADGKQLFSGVVENQTINYITYKNGYLYGCTTKYNGSGTALDKYPENPVLFVYDVAAMELVATHDIGISVPGLYTPIEMIDFVEEDPDVPGKFWGVVSDTLFSFTFDHNTKLFDVKIELSFGVDRCNPGGCAWSGRDVIFDGDFMYVAFGTKGTYAIERENPANYYKLTDVVIKHMVMAADNNIYYFATSDNNLSVLSIADIRSDIKDAYNRAQDLINALDEAANITLDDEAAVTAARKAYDNLSDEDKKNIENVEKLTAAETKLAELKAAAEKEAADKAAADAVTAKIAAIGTVTLESEAVIKAARAAYEMLTDDQKALVTNLNVLTAAETSLKTLQAASENPKTGDTAPVVLLATVLVMSAAALGAVLVTDIRKKHI